MAFDWMLELAGSKCQGLVWPRETAGRTGVGGVYWGVSILRTLEECEVAGFVIGWFMTGGAIVDGEGHVEKKPSPRDVGDDFCGRG